MAEFRQRFGHLAPLLPYYIVISLPDNWVEKFYLINGFGIEPCICHRREVL